MSVDLEIENAASLITRIVDEELEPYGQFVCDIYKGDNTQGDPSYFVEVCFQDQAQRVPAAVTVGLRSKLRTALLRLGDERFPYFKYLLDKQSV